VAAMVKYGVVLINYCVSTILGGGEIKKGFYYQTYPLVPMLAYAWMAGAYFPVVPV